MKEVRDAIFFIDFYFNNLIFELWKQLFKTLKKLIYLKVAFIENQFYF